MTKMLQEVVERIRKLSDKDQDALATILVEEIESEKKWDHLFGKSQDVLARLAAEAIAEDAHGETKPLMVNGEFTQD